MNHEMTEANTYINERSGKRQCRRCKKIRDSAVYHLRVINRQNQGLTELDSGMFYALPIEEQIAIRIERDIRNSPELDRRIADRNVRQLIARGFDIFIAGCYKNIVK